MTPELTVLALAALLQGLQFSLYSATSIAQVGPEKAAGPRDNKIELTGGAGRLQRALTNHFEGLILFTIAVVVISLGDKGTGFSATCAWTYLIARVLYVPAYYFGWVPWRSVIWFVGFLSTILMILSALI
ncbi:MAPEG family protein [Yoonia sediminilitoris]|uniref:Putative MAPEG superfamily protein n=1 Tax=Yoonia sediminilitoris TaxID=1286148 RepID=A0A2T6KKE9_9RHOB|nr:MAPEG family protein [Yoonia sediminilitoris]PUB16402.1 putative MAPEG superfamily protein [Yoonia sediminilitoris]RCW96751.1 putative MAPEG superfamily protein [Yoonia sediminilitoris]